MSQGNIKDQAEKDVSDVVERVEQEVERTKVPWYSVSSRRARIFVVIYLVEFVLFSLLAWYVHLYPVVPVDVTITREFQENQSPWLRISMIVVSAFGNIPLLMPATILITALIFWRLRLRLEALFIIGLSVASSVLNPLIKVIVNRPRPSANLVEIILGSSGQSFPSGHVMAYVAFWGLLFSFGIILFKRDRWWHYGLLIIPALFVVLIGPSRIYLGDHWASDVLGGYLFGGLLLGLGLWLYLRLKSNGVLQPKEEAGEKRLDPAPTPLNKPS